MTQRDIYFFEGELLRVTEDEKCIYFDLYKNSQERDPYFSFDFYIDGYDNYTVTFHNSKNDNIPEECKILLSLGRVQRCLNEYYYFVNAFDIEEGQISQ